ncbi:MAG: aspartate aminotransferase family protein [Pseudomonadota bacterium]
MSLIDVYARADLMFERGEGVYLYDTKGRRYLDFTAGVAVLSLGHCHPVLIETLTNQAGKLWHVSNLFRIAEQERVAALLCAHTFADAAFFCNSGGEAWETAIKMIRRYHDRQGHKKRWRVITFEGAFHGRSLTAIAAAGPGPMLDGFGPVSKGFDLVPVDNFNRLRSAITDETAAICLEPVQGEGGIYPFADKQLVEIRRICDEFDLLLLVDEIQAGIGRTGRVLAHEWAEITPDIACLAKGLGGGFPVGATIARKHVAEAMIPGSHGSTFGGNPLAMAIAAKILEIITEPDFLSHVQKTGAFLKEQLIEVQQQYPQVITQVRGHGLMIGLVVTCPPGELVSALREEGLLTVPARRETVRFLPPLIVDEAACAAACDTLKKVLAKRAEIEKETHS